MAHTETEAAKRPGESPLARVRRAVLWRLRGLGKIVYSRQELLFAEAVEEDILPGVDEAKLNSIIESLRLTARQATRHDLPLFRRYHRRSGRLGWGRTRMLLQRWARGDDCYVALDADGEVVAQVWLAYERCFIEGRWRRIPPDAIYCYGVDTRSDRYGSLGYIACCCAMRPAFLKHADRVRTIAWMEPRLFEKFRAVEAWLGLLRPRPAWIERYTWVCGFRFCRRVEVGPDWEFAAPRSRGGRGRR
jgi:hypothetical protein